MRSLLVVTEVERWWVGDGLRIRNERKRKKMKAKNYISRDLGLKQMLKR